jgi:DNA polymerase-1
VDVLPERVNRVTGRIHTSFNQTGAATGRLSSSDPNLQNIPVRTARGEVIRRGFVPGPGRRLVVADYSQIELRLLADLSEDPVLIQAFRTAAISTGRLRRCSSESR